MKTDKHRVYNDDDSYNRHSYSPRASKEYSNKGKRGRYEDGHFSGNDNSYRGGSYSSRTGDYSSLRNRHRDEEGHFKDTNSRATKGQSREFY